MKPVAFCVNTVDDARRVKLLIDQVTYVADNRSSIHRNRFTTNKGSMIGVPGIRLRLNMFGSFRLEF